MRDLQTIIQDNRAQQARFDAQQTSTERSLRNLRDAAEASARAQAGSHFLLEEALRHVTDVVLYRKIENALGVSRSTEQRLLEAIHASRVGVKAA